MPSGTKADSTRKKRGALARSVPERKRADQQKNIAGIDPSVRKAFSGHLKVLLRIRESIQKEAKAYGVRIRNVDIRPSYSHEDEDNSGVLVEVWVEADSQKRFSYWETLSKRVDSLANSLPPKDRDFLNRSLSVIVSRIDAV
jgi:hypothetical protein